MKITLDKVLLWLLPYLYLVSVMYYWGYWKTLEVDAISYYPTSDFITGIINASGFTSLLSLSYLIFLPLTMHYLLKLKSTGLLFTLFILLCSLCVLMYMPHYRVNMFSVSDLKYIIFKPIAMPVYDFMLLGGSLLLGFIIAIFIEDGFVSLLRGNLKDRFRAISLVMICSFPFLSYSQGERNAWNILNNQSFDYSLISVEGISKGIYKYLGKVGEHHFFKTIYNEENIIISIDKIPTLTLVRYTSLDIESSKRFITYRRRLIQANGKQRVNFSFKKDSLSAQ